MTSEDFEKFVRENREEILHILEEDDEREEKYTCPEPRMTSAEDIRDSFSRMTTEILKVMADEEVQKHFFNGITEFVKCMEAAVQAMPLSEDMKETVNQAGKTRDRTVRTAAKTGVKNTALSKLEKVNITNKLKKSDSKDE